jgi:hypothetical protein
MDPPTWSELFTMKLVGWTWIKDKEPDEGNARAVESILSQQPTFRASSFSFCKRGDECESFLNFGNQVEFIEPREMLLLT